MLLNYCSGTKRETGKPAPGSGTEMSPNSSQDGWGRRRDVANGHNHGHEMSKEWCKSMCFSACLPKVMPTERGSNDLRRRRNGHIAAHVTSPVKALHMRTLRPNSLLVETLRLVA